MQATAADLEQRLIAIARESSWFMRALSAASGLGLASWCIGAGAVRNLVWDALHEFQTPTPLTDVDLAYFDASSMESDRDAQLQARLNIILPDVPWEVSNQAAVHRWFEGYFGYPVAPLKSLHDAVGSWPEYATSVGISLASDNTLRVIAPHGLDDLFSMLIRHNPVRASSDTFQQRVAQKRFSQRWPKVRVVGC
jgi:hypothetical protein